MNSQSHENWILTQKLNMRDQEIRFLKQKIQFLKYENMIDRYFNKHRSMNQYDALMRVSNDFLKYAQTHLDDDATDYDSEDDEDTDDDDEVTEFPEETFTIDEFCKEYDWCPNKVQDLKDTFSF